MFRHVVFKIMLLLTVLVFTGCVEEQTEPQKQHFPPDAAIQELIESRIDENRAVGIVVGLMEADGSTRIFVAGDPGADARALDGQSVFEIGSITKVFTAIVLADMVAKGEVAYDDPVAKFLPEGEVSMPTRSGKQITLLDLATHRSALPRLPDNLKPADESNPYADYTVEKMYEFLSSHVLRRDIGAEAEYSNLGTGLLGHVLARVNDSSYEELVRQRILAPVGMSSTAINLNDDTQRRLAQGHDLAGNPTSNWDFSILAGAGALRSDVNDMLKFIAANVGAARSPLEEAMRDSHRERNSLGGNMAIGLNWIILTAADDKIIWHNGGTGGYRSFAGFDPDRGVAAVVLTNSSHGADDIGMHLINANLPLQAPPVERLEVDVPPDVLKKYIGEYQLAPEFIIAITVEGDTIWAQATGQPINQIHPESNTKFFLKVVDAQITFELDDSGSAKGLILHQGGADTPAQKL